MVCRCAYLGMGGMTPAAHNLGGDTREKLAICDELERLVLWELPRSHKGFRCQWEHDHIRRAFERAREMLASGNAHNHRCKCAGCLALSRARNGGQP
jgi:hypothetical protein